MKFQTKIILSTIFFLLSVVNIFAEAPTWFANVVKQRRAGVKEKTAPEFIEELWSTISSICNKYQMDPVFITTVIAIESNFTNVQGAGGVLGMMQIHPLTATSIAKLLNLEVPKDWNQLLTDYKLNITYGTAYLSYLYKKTGSLFSALESYNNGKNKTTYAQTVMKQYEYYKGLHEKELQSKQDVTKKQQNDTQISNNQTSAWVQNWQVPDSSCIYSPVDTN